MPEPIAAPPGWSIVHRSEVDSTQDELATLLSPVPRDRQVVFADRQRAGRGRAGRAWQSPDGGLWLSFSLLREPPPDPFLTLIVALAALRAVRPGLPPGADRLALKWPNDLVRDDRKWGGLLAEVSTGKEGCLYRVGVGLDLAIPADALEEAAGGALAPTSISREFGSSPSPSEVLLRMLPELDAALARDCREGREASRREIERELDTLGRRIQWQERDGTRQRGRAVALEASGGLRVELDEGTTRVLISTEIRHLRPDS